MGSQKSFELDPIGLEDQARRGWELQINGSVIPAVQEASLRNHRMGVSVDYGKRPEGYDGFVIREPGGAATIPYMIDADGGIYVGLVTEYRPTMGEPETHNIPRGFSDFNQGGKLESAEETAVRELREETGYQTLGNRLIKLAAGLNPNSTFFDYSRSSEAGVAIFALPIEQNELEIVANEGELHYAFPATIRDQATGDKSAERILGSRFVPLTEALSSRDMFTCAAAGQLMAHLLARGEYLVPQNQNFINKESNK